jgi:DNA-binding XRE family transcriptional regulator
MPNIASIFKQEILRLAGKAVRTAVMPLRKDKVALKKIARELKKRVERLEKDNKMLMGEQHRHKKLIIGAIPSDALSIRVTAKGMRSLRRKLGLTQEEFAKLVDVTAQTIWLWEQKEGALRVRDTTKKAIFAIRDLGAREAKRRLQDLS